MKELQNKLNMLAWAMEQAEKQTRIILNNWTGSIESKTKTLTNKEIDNIYKPMFEEMEEKHSKLYEQYYYLVHNNFDNKKINEINKNYSFISKEFINELIKEI